MPYIRRVCEVFCIPAIQLQGYEADDVIGTLSLQAVQQGLESVIVTSDKDMLQLVSDHVVVLDPMKDNMILDASRVKEKLGVAPEQVPDLLGLWGDSVDNIPGAPGIGEKGARELIQTYGNIDDLLKNWDKVRRKSYRESLRDNAELIRMSRDLVSIRRDLPISLNLPALILCEPDRKAAFALFTELEFKSLMREFLDEEGGEALKGRWLSGTEAEGFLQALADNDAVHFELGHAEGVLGRRVAVLACIQGDDGDAGVVDLSEHSSALLWRRIMASSAQRKICWDSKLCLVSQEIRGIPLGTRLDDVMLMAFLIAPHVGDYSLSRWALDQLHVSLTEEKYNDRDSLLGDKDVIVEHLCLRLASVRKLYELLGPQLDELRLRKLYEEIELPLMPVLADMERAGIKVDRGTLLQMSSVMERQLVELRQKIFQAAGLEFNINSPKQLGEVLFEKLNLPILKKTRRTKGYSTDQLVLEELAEIYLLPRLILEYRQVSKLKSTYVDALPALINPATGRVHTSFNQTGAATGRLSSSNPNLQNIPIRSDLGRLIRGAFVAEEGSLLVSADYSQVELRVLAHLSEDQVLIEAFRKGEDIHERTAREVFSEAELANSAECRRWAKVINFGIVYGLSAFGLAQKLGISKESAQAFIDAYFQRYSGVRVWLDATVNEVRKTGHVRTLFGRIRSIPEIRSRDRNIRHFAERIAVNSPIQGTAADIVKIAMVRLSRALHERHLSARILLQVHDELVLEVPEREVDEVCKLAKKEMEGAATLRVPLKVDLNIADNWMDMK